MTCDRLRRRASVYAWLARLFWDADETTLGLFPPPAPDLVTLQDQYARLMLGRGADRATPSALHETSCTRLGRFAGPAQMADIAGFYRAFGLQMGSGRGRPDHIAAELEFVAFLMDLEADAVERGHLEHVAVCADARAAFLRDHVACWTGLLQRRVCDLVTADSPYAVAAAVVHGLIQSDARRLGVAVDEEPPSTCGAPEIDVPFTCPFAAIETVEAVP